MQCLNAHSLKGCRVFTLKSSICKLYAVEKGMQVVAFDSIPYILEEHLFEDLGHHIDNYHIGFPRQVSVHKVSGSKIMGCFRHEIISGMILLENATTPWECTLICFGKGYENAALAFGGFCSCGDAEISGAHSAVSADSRCNMPCTKDKSASCGGIGHTLLYQKPVRCFRGYMKQLDGIFYCMHFSKLVYSEAEQSCKTETSHEEILNPTWRLSTFNFIKSWMLNIYSNSLLEKGRLQAVSFWVGRLVDFNSSIPKWVRWSEYASGQNQALCVVLHLDILSGHSPIVRGSLRVSDCDLVQHSYICDMGECDGEGNCQGSKGAKDFTKEIQLDMEFVSVLGPSITWHGAREMCLQRRKDLCLSNDVCKNYLSIFVPEEVSVLTTKHLWIPVRDSFKDWMYLNTEAPERCHPKWDSQRAAVSAEQPANLETTMQGIFCCGKHDGVKPDSIHDQSLILASQRKGSMKLITISGTALHLKWIGSDVNACCNYCFEAIATGNHSKATEFYKILHGHDEHWDVVAFESVHAPGYFLSSCTDLTTSNTILVAKSWRSALHRTFKVKNNYAKACIVYESFERESHVIYHHSTTFIIGTSSPIKLESSCFTSSPGVQSYFVLPELHTWQYAKDFCNLRGQDLCESDLVCKMIDISHSNFWISTRNFYNDWVLRELSGQCNKYSPSLPSPFWGYKPGACPPNDTQTSCDYKGRIYCCDSVEYLEDNMEDLVEKIDLSPSPGHAIEYGYGNENFLNDILGSGFGEGSGFVKINMPNNTTEKDCYKLRKIEGYYGYGYDENSSVCFGILENDFLDNLENISQEQQKGSVRIVKIERITDDAVQATLFKNGFYQSVELSKSLYKSLYSFTLSMWYTDINLQGGTLITYIHMVDSKNTETMMTVQMSRNLESLSVYLCGESLIYRTNANYKGKYSPVLWHHIAVQLKEGYGLSAYFDGIRMYEPSGENVGSDCNLPPNGSFILGGGNIGSANGSKIVPKFALTLDLWDRAVGEVNIKNIVIWPSDYGNIVSSALVKNYMDDNDFNVPQNFFKLCGLMNKEVPCTIFVQKENCTELQLLSTWWLPNEHENFYANNISASVNNYTRTIDFQFYSISEQYGIAMQPTYLEKPQYFNLINIGKGNFIIKKAENAQGYFQFYHRPDLFKVSKLISSHSRSASFKMHDNFWQIQTVSCTEVLPVGFNGSNLERQHVTHHFRTCLKRMWKEAGCKAPLFHYGTFFDYLMEMWRKRSRDGGLRSQHIEDLMLFAHAKAMQADSKYFKLCFGGYTVRLLRISQRLRSTIYVAPSENMRSGILQFYDDHFGWGAVCVQNLLDTNFADVACRELGYSGVDLVTYAKLKNGLRVTFKNPMCTGNEKRLQDCTRSTHHCDWTEIVHVTCASNLKLCGKEWTQISDNLCVTVKKFSAAESASLYAAGHTCHIRGGMLPELRSLLVADVLPIHMSRIGIKKIWLGAHLREGAIRWLSTGDVINTTQLTTEEEQNCFVYHKDKSWKRTLCNFSMETDVVCMKPTSCPSEFIGTECEMVKCPVQYIQSIDMSCTSDTNQSLYTTCNYKCKGLGKYVGMPARQCIMTEFGPMWNAVDPICSAAVGLSAEHICSTQKACNNGTCKQVSDNLYRCECDAGYSGPNCRMHNTSSHSLPSISQNPCMHMRCRNYALCVPDGNYAQCICRPGYFGAWCEKYSRLICKSNPCLNGGRCLQTGDKSYICRCPEGYVGKSCHFLEKIHGPAACTIPFFYKGQKYHGCTSIDIQKYQSLGCWKRTRTLYPEIKMDDLLSTRNVSFKDQCFQECLERGYIGFAVSSYHGSYYCYGDAQVLKKYTRYGTSNFCQHGNDTQSVEVFSIKHDYNGLKWCSKSYIYDGNWTACESKKRRILLQPDPVKQIMFSSDSTCFDRRSASMNVIDESMHKTLLYISQILSCVHYGRSTVQSLERESGSKWKFRFLNSSCNFASYRGDVVQFSCFASSGSNDKNLYLCDTSNQHQAYCLHEYNAQYMGCTTANGEPGYSLTTTFGGQSHGAKCVFPFEDNGKTIKTCELGWCYTNVEQTDWAYCIQGECDAFPRPMTSAQDEFGRETVVKKHVTCPDLDHMYFGRGISRYSCEQACANSVQCLGYLFLPEFEIFFYQGRTYSYHSTPSGHVDAKEVCASLSGTLMKMNDLDLYAAVTGDMISRNLQSLDYWIDSSWEDDDCVVLSNTFETYQSKRWKRSSACQDTHPFICQQDASEDVLEMSSIGKVPGNLGYCFGLKEVRSWKLLGGSKQEFQGLVSQWGWKEECNRNQYYGKVTSNRLLSTEPYTRRRWKISHFKANWTNAQHECQSEGGHLGIIDSYEMERYMKDLMNNNGMCIAAYIGLKDDLKQWIDGSMVHYHNMETATSSTLPPKCSTMTCSFDSKWQSINCDSLRHFICEYPALNEPGIEDFMKMGIGMKAEVADLNLLDHRINTSDVDYCMHLCWKNIYVTPCKGFIVNETTCYLLSNLRQLTYTHNGDFNVFLKKRRSFQCDQSILASLGSFHVTLSDKAHETKGKKIVHTNSHKPYCYRMHNDGGAIMVLMDFTLVMEVTMISVNLYWENVATDRIQLMRSGPSTTVYVKYSDGDGDWRSLNIYLLNGESMHPLSVPIIAELMNVSVPYPAPSSDDSQSICIEFDVAGCVQQLQVPPTSCQEVDQSFAKVFNSSGGVFDIYLKSMERTIEVYCDLETDGGGWTVFQRRMDGSEEFYRDWDDYVDGFGRKDGEFWLGLEAIHQMTKNGGYELRVDLTDWSGNTAFAKFETFSIANGADNYRLDVGDYSGTAGDSMDYMNGMQFSTKNAEHDFNPWEHCSRVYRGAWWYNACHNSNLNGLYHQHVGVGSHGVVWWAWKGKFEYLKFTEMKLRKRRE